MTIELRPLHPLFVAEVEGIDLRRPLESADVVAIKTAIDQHGVLVFRHQSLSQFEQIQFAESFGPLDTGLGKLYGNVKRPSRFDYETLLDISNVEVDGSVSDRDSRKNMSNLANQMWHSDSSFQQPKGQYSMLSAVVIPAQGGATEYADLRAAYDTLPDDLRQEIQGLVAEHYALHTRIMLGDTSYTEAQLEAMPPVHWPIAQLHAGSNRPVLFVGVHARLIVDYPLAEGRMLLSELLEHATQPQFVHRHEWSVGDLVMWDNRCTLHRGRRYDLSQRREMRRTTTDDLDPVRALA
ncbi:MAG: alpha-ketoglutarate-dependent 2,4-dichlorophenoxyacetate dioxygenase [Acidimicrobiales bacterium]|jgi:alpha-ketoglutarate-dependent 2,4-dichlorophenoxyacetate dioxygenase